MQTMRHPAWVVVAVLVLMALLATVVLWPSRELPPVVVAAAGPAPANSLPPSPVERAVPAFLPAAVSAGSAAAPQVAASGARSAGGVFESDAAGRLVIDERMRLALESLAGLNPAAAWPGLIEAEVQGLPANAAAAARELARRFEDYQEAQRAAFAPGTAPLVPEEGLAELETLVALRTSYFGADAARRLFGADEAVARRLLKLMSEDQASTLSMEQKAMRAQQRFDQERGVAPAGR